LNYRLPFYVPLYLLRSILTASGRNFLNGQGGVGLTMSALNPITFPTFLLENKNLIGLSLLHYLGDDLSPVNNRLSDFDIITVDHHQDVRQLNGITDTSLQFFDPQFIAGCDLILFTAGANNCVHEIPPTIQNSIKMTISKQKREKVLLILDFPRSYLQSNLCADADDTSCFAELRI